MRSRQRGISLISFILIAAMAGVLGFAALKLSPVYLEYFRVKQVLNDVKTQFDGQEASVQALRGALSKRLDVEAVETINADDFKVEKNEAGLKVRAQYERIVPFLANVSFLVSFDDAVELRH